MEKISKTFFISIFGMYQKIDIYFYEILCICMNMKKDGGGLHPCTFDLFYHAQHSFYNRR
jgi:hypothetical protein